MKMKVFLILLVGALSFIAISSVGTAARSSSVNMQKWEYKVVSVSTLLEIKSADKAIGQIFNTNMLKDSNFE